jgi:hypothetical protein
MSDRLGMMTNESVFASNPAHGIGKQGECRFKSSTAVSQRMASGALSDETIDILQGILYDAPFHSSGEQTTKKERRSGEKTCGAHRENGLSYLLDFALFGKKTQSVAFSDIEPAVHIAHAISTHNIEQPLDFFGAADELQSFWENNSSPNAAGSKIETVCFYRYSSLDLDALGRNLTDPFVTAGFGDDLPEPLELLRKGCDTFVGCALEAALTVDIAPQNTIPFPDVALVELRPFPVPMSYAGAFIEPIHYSSSSIVEKSLERLIGHAKRVTADYNLPLRRRILCAPNFSQVGLMRAGKTVGPNQITESLWEEVYHA